MFFSDNGTRIWLFCGPGVADRKILIAILEMATGRNKQRPYSKGELRDF